MVPSIKSKLPRQGTTIFTVMSALAAQHQAINLAQGFPDFPCNPLYIEKVNQAMKAGHNQYAPMAGVMALREQIAIKTENLYSSVYDPETEITITPGGTLAIFAAIQAVIRENDEVIVIEPCYDSYVPAIELAGGRPVYASFKMPEGKIDWKEIKKLVTQHTRMIMINSPNNPMGRVLNAADMLELSKLTDQTDIIVLSDEVYEHILFDQIEHQSVARYPKLKERSFIISSFGKTYHTTGWKMGYCTGPAELMKEFRKVYQFMQFSAFTPLQYALVDMLKDQDSYKTLGAFLQEKRDTFRKLLQGSRLKLLPCQGSYFQLASYEKISALPDREFARWLTEQHGVATIPVSAFYQNGTDLHLLRFCFAKKEETLYKAAEKLMGI